MLAGDPARTRAALASREQELDRASLRRVRATAALYGYLERSGQLAGTDSLAGEKPPDEDR
jgi:hypothetical protein